MDQDAAWWTTFVFGADGDTGLPRYLQIVADIEHAIETRTLTHGQRLPAERTLAAALCVSRGTVVRAFEELAERGTIERIHGSGTFVRANPSTPLRHVRHIDSAADDPGDVIDLSQAAPADPSHLPDIDWGFDPLTHGSGITARGLPMLQEALAAHLTRLGLPTTGDQIIVTTSTADAVDVVLRSNCAGKRPAVLATPTWPALRSVFSEHTAASLCLYPDAGGVDPAALRRALRRTAASVVLVDTVEAGPVGRATATSRFPRIAAAIEDHTAVALEDLSFLACEAVNDPQIRPLSALSGRFTAMGDLGRVFWAGCGVAWLREAAPAESLLGAALRIPRPAASAQVHAARLLVAATPQWFAERLDHLSEHVRHLIRRLGEVLPSWKIESATAGDGVWVRLPVLDASTFAHVAARSGVKVCSGQGCVTDGGLREYIRISAAADKPTLELAMDRLAEAWATYTRRLASSV